LLGSNFAGWDVEDKYQDMIGKLQLPPGGAEAILGQNAKRIFRL
jgi:predicted TIM-barrel fold metal-dependent hydrolase